MPYFALSWILTWFSHDFEDYDKVVRLFDLFIASHAVMPVYVASAVKWWWCLCIDKPLTKHSLFWYIDHFITEKGDIKIRERLGTFINNTYTTEYGHRKDHREGSYFRE